MKKATQFSGWALGGLALAVLALTAWSQPPAGNEAPVKLKVIVPDPNAALTVDGLPTKQTGKERFFESPPLPVNKKYTYTIKITWRVNNKEKSETRKVRVQGGRDVEVDFTKPPPGSMKKDVTKDLVTDTVRKDLGKRDTGKKDTVKKENGKSDTGKKDTGTDKDTGTKDLNPLPDTGKKADKKAPTDKDLLDKGAAAPRARDFFFTGAGTVTGRPSLSDVDRRARLVARRQPLRG
jgi:uncharacterized protein (TIGR03000 family)